MRFVNTKDIIIPLGGSREPKRNNVNSVPAGPVHQTINFVFS